MVNEFRLGIVCGFILGIAVCAIFLARRDDPYKKGQIDAITGNVHYHLVTMPDSSRIWVEKSSLDKEMKR